MPKPQTDALLQLISSMTKSEKRHLRIFVNRNQTTEDALFMRLFDELDKMKNYDEELILKKIPEIKKQQISNLKAHLYKQILLCLRLIHRNYNEDIELREKIDYARILYNKGLYRQSLDLLDKAKQAAIRLNLHSIALQAVDFEKLIESQFATGNKTDRAEQLVKESKELINTIDRQQSFSNLSLLLLNRYLKVGYARNAQDYTEAKDFLKEHIPPYNFDALSLAEKLSLSQSYVEFYAITQEFVMVYKHAQRWVELLEDHQEMLENNMPNYLRGLHNLLIALFFLNQQDKFVANLKKLEGITKKADLDTNTESLAQLYTYIHRINQHYMKGTFSEGLKWIHQLEKILKNNDYGWDENRILVMHYKIACLYFGSGNSSKAVDHLNIIINSRNPDYREDIQCFARILNLISHYELGNMQLVEYQAKSVYRFLLKAGDLHEVQKLVLQFIRKMPYMTPSLVKKEFISLKKNLEQVKALPYEQRPFLYLDIISWLESKILGKKLELIIQEKANLTKTF
jgi:hypothetical protein